MKKSVTKNRTTQTTTIGGKRVRLVTTAAGIRVEAAPILEWQLQAAQCRALRALPEYGKRFLFAGDQNAAKRGSTATAQAKAAGMTPGEADLRIYLEGGRLGLIENKVGRAGLTESQVTRHPQLAAIGNPVAVLRATSEADAAEQAVRLVRGWLSMGLAEQKPGANANDNEKRPDTAPKAKRAPAG